MLGAAIALLTASALYLSSWTPRPQDRPQETWRAIVEAGVSGFVLAGCAMAAAVLFLTLATVRAFRDREPEVLVGPGVVMLVAMGLCLFALHVGLPELGQVIYVLERPWIF